MRSGRIVGAEALIRWRHPQHGMIQPLQFISLAEEAGLIVAIGAWMIDAVCGQQAAWLAQRIKVVPVAINLSAVQFRKEGALEIITDILKLYRLAPKHVEFELTESIVMCNPEESVYSLQKLKNLGGKTLLGQFRHRLFVAGLAQAFPFDFVKIDRILGCDEMQGYYFSKPMQADEFVAMLHEGKRLTFPKYAACCRL